MFCPKDSPEEACKTYHARQEAQRRQVLALRQARGMAPPKPPSLPTVAYPLRARQEGLEGLVILRCRIRKTGEVRLCRAVFGHPLFVNAARDMVLSNPMVPVTFEGAPVEVDYQFNLRFRMR